MSANLRIALVGAGSMGSLHARVITQSERADLAYVVDSNAETGAAVAARYGTGWHAELGGLDDVDAVVVAAATEAHHELGRRVLERGLPLLMEKPLALHLAQGEDLVESSAKYDVPLMVGLLERFNPAIMTALAIVEAPKHVSAVRHSPYVPRIRTGVSSDLLIHDVDIVLRLAAADPTEVRGSFGYLHPDSQPDSEDVAEASLRFADGMVATVSASRLSQRKVRAFTIAELDRLVEIDMLRNAVTIYRNVANGNGDDGLSYRQQAIVEIPQLVSAREPLAAQLDRFLDLVGGRVDPSVERASILPAHTVVDRIRADATG